MKWVLIILGGLTLLELVVWLDLFWRRRKVIASILVLAESLVTGLAFGLSPGVWTALILLAEAYRVINLLRLVEGRSEPKYLSSVYKRTYIRLVLGQLILTGIWQLNRHIKIKLSVWMLILAALDLIAAAVLLSSTNRHIKTTRIAKRDTPMATRDLPSLSVLIPARNETEDLEQCLSTLVASTYPKLEIIVLDDCSQNKHTPEIIKGFAQAGVRFIAGKLPPDNWLAKNYAYQQLSEQASGDILVFCGVDTRFSPDTITNLVETLIEKKKVMSSVMPINKLSSGFSLSQTLVQPSRYAWELALPRKSFKRPPVLSTCWLIYSNKLNHYGGLKAVMRSASPESYFARQAARDKDSYSFMRSNADLGLVSVKSYVEQRSTAIRTRYPQLHRRLELSALFSLIEVGVFILPIYGVVYAAISSHWLILGLNAVSLVLLSVFYVAICRLTYDKFLLRSLLIWPVMALYDIGLLNYSMWQYEFREVIWKGRNVCLPVMRFPLSSELK